MVNESGSKDDSKIKGFADLANNLLKNFKTNWNDPSKILKGKWDKMKKAVPSSRVSGRTSPPALNRDGSLKKKGER